MRGGGDLGQRNEGLMAGDPEGLGYVCHRPFDAVAARSGCQTHPAYPKDEAGATHEVELVIEGFARRPTG